MIPMKSDKINPILCTLFFIVLAAITFRCTWPPDMVFSASDMNIGRLAQMKNNLPESFIGSYSANQLFGNSGHGITLFKVLLTLMPLEVFANVFYGLMLLLSSLSMVWFLRMWNRTWTASVFGALVGFWFNSIMLATAGHVYKMEVLAFSMLGLCFIEKAMRAELLRKAVGWAILAGLAVGIMMVEQQDVALLAGLFMGSYALFRLIQDHAKAWPRWLAVLVPIGVVALLLAGSPMSRAYDKHIKKAASIQGAAEDKWNFITQWSMVPGEWPDLVASGWSGWSSNNPDGPYWGRIGQSAEWEKTKQGFRNFKLTSIYFGIIPFMLGAFGLAVAVRNRKEGNAGVVLFWGIAGLVGLWLAFGKYSILYKLFFQLPLVNNIRAPMKFLDNFQVCLGIVAAYGLDSLLASGKKGKSVKILWIAGSIVGGVMLLAGLRHVVSPTDAIARFKEMGFAGQAETMVANMSNAWFHAAWLSIICAALVFVVWKGWKPAKWAGLAFIAVLAVDSVLLTSHYFKATNIAPLKKGNVVINFLKENQGNERTFFMDQSGLYNQWLASDGRYHDLNLFNIWQMPRMPVDYKEFLGTVGKNQVRMWELASIKYVAAPAQIQQQLQQNPQLAELFEPVLNYQVPTSQGMRKDVLLEFKGSIPRFALFHAWESVPPEEQCQRLASIRYNPHTTVLVDPADSLGEQAGGASFQALEAKATGRSATVAVSADQKTIVRFSQYYQPQWKVYVDGKPAKLLRVDFLCMGVAVESGEHVVEFVRAGGGTRVAFMSAVFIASLLAAVWLVRLARRGSAE